MGLDHLAAYSTRISIYPSLINIQRYIDYLQSLYRQEYKSEGAQYIVDQEPVILQYLQELYFLEPKMQMQIQKLKQDLIFLRKLFSS